MPNPNMQQKKYLGQGKPEPEERFKHAFSVGGGIIGQGRPDFNKGMGGGFRNLNAAFSGASGGLPPGLGIGGGNSLQALIENRLRRRKRYEMDPMQQQPTQGRMLGRYLGGGDSGY